MQNEARPASAPTFGTLLRVHRVAAGLSQEALAERARMSINGISALERGYRRTPQRETLALLAEALALDDEDRKAFEAAARPATVADLHAASVTVGPWPNGDIASLPLAMSSFIGREREVAEISTLVREHRLVTITGAGGVGKTQTALQVVTSGDDAIDAICFVGLAPARESAAVAIAIASALGVQEVPNRPLLETLSAYLKDRQLLLVLDNCEHLVEDAARIATALLAACPRLGILATSREPLRVTAEYAYRLPSLDLSSAVALFTDRAKAADSHFDLIPDNDGPIAELCKRLDGIPLAIELAAARVNVLPVKDLATKIGGGLQILSGGERSAPPRQQTMRATIEWSYNLLSPPEQRVFERLSVFAGGCTLEAAAFVCFNQKTIEAELVDLLTSLVGKSLVVAELRRREPRYRLLEPFRDYAREKLAMRGEQQVISRRHATACLDLAERNSAVARWESDGRFIELAQPDIDNCRAALQWTIAKRGDIQLGQQLAGALTHVWIFFATVEGKRWVDTASGMVDEATSPDLLASLNNARAGIAWQLAECSTQLACAESAAARYREVDDRVSLVGMLAMMGNALLSLGKAQEARIPLEECLKTAAELDYPRMEAWAHVQLSYTDESCGEITSAQNHLILARPLYRRVRSHLGEAVSLLRLSALFRASGNAAAALQSATESARLWGLTSNQSSGALSQSYALSLLEVCRCLVALTRYRDAGVPGIEVLKLAREGQFDHVIALALAQLGVISALSCRGDPEMRRGLELAARLLGSADARMAASVRARPHGEDPARYEEALQILYGAMGTAAVTEMMTAGAAMSDEQISDEAARFDAPVYASPRPSIGAPAE